MTATARIDDPLVVADLERQLAHWLAAAHTFRDAEEFASPQMLASAALPVTAESLTDSVEIIEHTRATAVPAGDEATARGYARGPRRRRPHSRGDRRVRYSRPHSNGRWPRFVERRDRHCHRAVRTIHDSRFMTDDWPR